MYPTMVSLLVSAQKSSRDRVFTDSVIQCESMSRGQEVEFSVPIYSSDSTIHLTDLDTIGSHISIHMIAIDKDAPSNISGGS
jgi:hypothetical protein